MGRATKVITKRFQAEEFDSTNSAGAFRVAIVIPKTIYGIRLKMDTVGGSRPTFRWLLKRAPGVTEVPDYDDEFGADGDIDTTNDADNNERGEDKNYVTKLWGDIAHHTIDIVIEDIRLFDNHVLWIEYFGTTGDDGRFFELVYLTGI